MPRGPLHPVLATRLLPGRETQGEQAQEGTQGVLRNPISSDIPLLLPHSVLQTRARVQPAVQGRRIKRHRLKGDTAGIWGHIWKIAISSERMSLPLWVETVSRELTACERSAHPRTVRSLQKQPPPPRPHAGFRRFHLFDDAFRLVVITAQVDPGKAELKGYLSAGGDPRKTRAGPTRFTVPAPWGIARSLAGPEDSQVSSLSRK